MRYLVFVLLLCLSVPAHAWSEADTRRQVGYFVLHTIDWGQSLGQYDEYSETNPILGSHPSRGDVNRYFLLTGIAHYGISRSLPPAYRKWWQRVTIGVQAGAVAHNFSIGVDVRF